MLAEFSSDNKADFKTDSTLCANYNHYLKAVGSISTLGDGLNKHMSMYYAWRFRSIRLKSSGNKTEADIIRSQDSKFKKHEAVLSKEVSSLEGKENLAKLSLNGLLIAREMQSEHLGSSAGKKTFSVSDANVTKARETYQISRSARLRAKARRDSVPNMKNYQAMLNLYDRQLLEDVIAIRAAISTPSSRVKRSDLRPHYKLLLDAYENEFEKNNGLKDERVISFFDNYVHDSLAGFAKDATLPSDPRVVYLGGDQKYKYASLENHEPTGLGREVRMA